MKPKVQERLESAVISYADFEKVDLRAGTIIRAEAFNDARAPAYKLWVDLGDLGIKQSSVQITDIYGLGELVGMQVVCVVNFEPKRIAGFKSEILVCGFDRGDREVVLVQPGLPVPNGSRLY